MASRKPRTLPISTTPEFGEQSRSRLDALLALAMAYRRWTQRQLAHFLGRDVHNIVPGSGVPKLDVVIRLAEALGWPVALVLDGLRPQPSGYPTSEAGAGRSFDSLNRAAFWASVHGRHQEAIELAKAALGSAESGSQQAEADKRLSVAWDGLGDFTSAIECARRGLSRSGVGSLLRAELRWNLGRWYLAPTLEWSPQRSYIDHANSFAADSYAIAGLRIGGEAGTQWRWFVDARNLGDKRYAATTGVIADALGRDSRQFLPGDGRSVFAGIEWRR